MPQVYVVNIKVRTFNVILNEQFVWITVPPTCGCHETWWIKLKFGRNRTKRRKSRHTGSCLTAKSRYYENEEMAIFSSLNAILDSFFAWNRCLEVCSFDSSRQADHFAVKYDSGVFIRVCRLASVRMINVRNFAFLCTHTHLSKPDVTFYTRYTGLNGAIDNWVSSVLVVYICFFSGGRFHLSVRSVRNSNVRYSTGPD